MPHRTTGFRHDGKRSHEWRRWVEVNRTLIEALSIPADVTATQQDFEYLLHHGYNRAGWWNEQPWFEIRRMDAVDASCRDRFWMLLESYVAAFCPAAERTRELEAF